jgi:hypothetical protein
VEGFNEFIELHPESILYLGTAGIWLLHYFGHSKQMIFATAGVVGLCVLIFIIVARKPEPLRLSQLASVLLLYGVGLYVMLGDVMLMGFARYITKKRGEKWTKELDYLYLTIGSVGILGALNRVEFLTGRLEGADIIAPLVLTTAVVIRFIKTRAEIEGWNKI